MAATSVILDIRANTNRALNEFKKFSAQLDNKFLVSGLKLDVVRSALGQINREFQRAIGEQGLASGQSLRAAQNQAALILNTFKNVGLESSLAITEQFSTAFSDIAVKAGGSAEDIKKALGASSWISTNLSEDVRKQLAQGVAEFQIFARQAGLGNNYAEIVQQFLAGQVTARQLINSGKPLESTIGVALSQASGGNIDEIVNAEQRSRIVQQLQNSSQLRTTLQQMIARADWGFTIIEQLNARLFNPERGVFGVLRQVTMAVGDKTSILRETRKLIESVFGQQGLFVNFFKQIGKIFGLEDPLKVVIIGVRFLTRQFKKLNEFVQSTEFQTIIGLIQSSFNTIKDFVTKLVNSITTDLQNPDSVIGQIRGAGDSIFKFFESILNTIESGNWDPSNIISSIQEIGSKIRGFIESIGKSIRESDVTKQGEFFLGIFKTVIGEVAQTLGTVIKEAIGIVFSAKGAAVLGGAIQVLASAIGGLFKGVFTNANFIQSLFGGAALLTVGAIFAKRITSGLLRLADRFIRALPGGDRLSESIRRRLPTRFGGRSGIDTPGTFEGGRLGFQAQIINRMDAIIRLLGQQVGIDTPIASDLPPRGRQQRGTRIGRDGRTSAQRARDIARLRRGGSVGSGIGSRIINATRGFGGAFNALPAPAKGAIAVGTVLATLGIAGTVMPSKGNTSELEDQLAQLPAGDRKLVEQEIKNQEKQESRQNTRGILGLLANIGAGAGTGAALGAVGANPLTVAVGGIIGGIAGGFLGEAAVQALNDQVIDNINDFGKETQKIWESAGKNISEETKKGIRWIKDGFGSISRWFSEIDWKTVLINALVPGGNTTIEGLKGIAQFASKLDIFDGIKTGVGAVKDVAENIFTGLKSMPLFGLAFREAGGPVIKGTSYIVGERGPEIFTPGQSGIISPNRELTSLGFDLSVVSPIKNILDKINRWELPRNNSNSKENFSGGKVAINDRKFVISRDESLVLADAISNRLPSQRKETATSQVYANFDVDINVNGAIGMNNIEELRAPIIAIINQAWSEATVGVTTRGSVV